MGSNPAEIPGSVRSAVRIDCHGDQLLSANYEKLLSLWNLRDGSLVRSAPFTDGRISRVRLHQPFGVCLSWSPDLQHDRIIVLNVDRMELLHRIDISGSVSAIGLNCRRIIVHTSERKILHAQLDNLGDNGSVKFEQVYGVPVGKALESRECELEQDQVITAGSKFQPPGTVHIQNYWYGEFPEMVEKKEQKISFLSPKFWLVMSFNLTFGLIRASLLKIWSLFESRR